VAALSWLPGALSDDSSRAEGPPGASTRWGRHSLLVSASIFVTYLLAARGVRNLFPLSVFDMYKSHAPDVATRIIAVDAAGRAEELHAFEAFRCEPAAPRLDELRSCEHAERGRIPYVVRDAQIYLDQHLRGDARGEEVTIAARTWRLQGRPGPLPFADCALARCVARRKP
jgi:hypothetical protein